ncbi:MAG: iron ABC transporter permease, partial [Roseibacillus sp.]|nr:iron ABC transporter permease [Roseibacillus sp.]
MIAIARQGIEGLRKPRGLRTRQHFLLIALLSTLGLVTVLAAAFGAVPVTYEGVFEAGSIDQVVFTDIRAPRVLLAAVVGMGLSISGAILQGLFRNPLADPGLIGVSSGAALGAISMIVLGSALNVPEILTPYLL